MQLSAPEIQFHLWQCRLFKFSPLSLLSPPFWAMDLSSAGVGQLMVATLAMHKSGSGMCDRSTPRSKHLLPFAATVPLSPGVMLASVATAMLCRMH